MGDKNLTAISNISNWIVTNVTGMASMFNNAINFNGDLSSWNTENVTTMNSMFSQDAAFNSDINGWNTANVTDFGDMFYYAQAFNQNLGGWSLANAQDLSDMLSNSGLSCANFDATLIGWADSIAAGKWQNVVGVGMSFGATGLAYDVDNHAVVAALDTLIKAGWTYDYNPADNNGALPSFDGSDIATVNSAVTNAVTTIGVFGATPTGAGQNGCPASLPIKLVSFTAQAQSANAVLLQWTTATETNNKGFTVQRSADGANWVTVGFVNSQAANGNSSVQLNYSYTDAAPLNGTNYYRLVQTDIDGTLAYSAVESVQMSANTAQAAVYPNPAKSTLNVSVKTAATYQLINAAGAIVAKGVLNAGNNEVNVSGLADGIYFLSITATGVGSSTHEVEIMR